MAITQYYVNPAIAGNSGTGAIGDPYGDLQYALNTITRDSTNGDQINIKAGTAEVLAAALTLATYGAPTDPAPLVLRGYTSAANDGGVGEINAGGTTLWSGAYNYVVLADLALHTFGDNNGISTGQECIIYRCAVHQGSSTPNTKRLILANGIGCAIVNNRVYSAGTNGVGIDLNADGTLAGWNYLYDIPNIAFNLGGAEGSVIIGNAVNLSNTTAKGVQGAGLAAGYHVIGNSFFNSTAATTYGIGFPTAGRQSGVVMNNIVSGWSGAGGVGITVADTVYMAGYNAFYNNTTSYSAGKAVIDLTAGDVTLAAEPFTDASNGDFSLTEAAQTALRSLGWPASYPGAHANTDPHITIGALQYGPTPAASGGGAVSISPFRGNF